MNVERRCVCVAQNGLRAAALSTEEFTSLERAAVTCGGPRVDDPVAGLATARVAALLVAFETEAARVAALPFFDRRFYGVLGDAADEVFTIVAVEVLTGEAVGTEPDASTAVL